MATFSSVLPHSAPLTVSRRGNPSAVGLQMKSEEVSPATPSLVALRRSDWICTLVNTTTPFLPRSVRHVRKLPVNGISREYKL